MAQAEMTFLFLWFQQHARSRSFIAGKVQGKGKDYHERILRELEDLRGIAYHSLRLHLQNGVQESADRVQVYLEHLKLQNETY